MKEILIGTHNRHKTREISNLLSGLPLKIRDLTEFPRVKPVREDGATLLANAVKKSKTYGEQTGLPCLADDTGLEVEALGGEPGVTSARYAGEQCSYEDNNRKLLKSMAQIQNGKHLNRKAVFKTVMAFYDPKTRQVETREGAIHGEILDSQRGTNGFGYDPVFFLPDQGKTLAELTLEEKNKVSHRALALRNIKEIIRRKFFVQAGA